MHSTEALRRERLRMLRETLAAEGYDGCVSLPDRNGSPHIALSPEPGLDDARLSVELPGGLDGSVDDMLTEARVLTDRAGIAQRRAQAIIDGGGILTDPPAWAFLGSPLARGAYAAMGFDLSEFRPRTAVAPQGMQLGLRTIDFRLATAALRLQRNGLTITMDADNDAARIRLLGGAWPDTLVETLAGRSVGDVIELPGAERGTAAGEAVIVRVWTEADGIGMTVRCGPEPMGTVPEGIDAGFLTEWADRHYR